MRELQGGDFPQEHGNCVNDLIFREQDFIKGKASVCSMHILNSELTRDGWNLTAWAPCLRERLCLKQRGLGEARSQRQC